jgi:hypothetical protein
MATQRTAVEVDPVVERLISLRAGAGGSPFEPGLGRFNRSTGTGSSTVSHALSRRPWTGVGTELLLTPTARVSPGSRSQTRSERVAFESRKLLLTASLRLPSGW